MKIYEAEYLYDYETSSLGLYSSLKEAIENALAAESLDTLLFITERHVDGNPIYDKPVWECEEGVETFYA